MTFMKYLNYIKEEYYFVKKSSNFVKIFITTSELKFQTNKLKIERVDNSLLNYYLTCRYKIDNLT